MVHEIIFIPGVCQFTMNNSQLYSKEIINLLPNEKKDATEKFV